MQTEIEKDENFALIYKYDIGRPWVQLYHIILYGIKKKCGIRILHMLTTYCSVYLEKNKLRKVPYSLSAKRPEVLCLSAA